MDHSKLEMACCEECGSETYEALNVLWTHTANPSGIKIDTPQPWEGKKIKRWRVYSLTTDGSAWRPCSLKIPELPCNDYMCNMNTTPAQESGQSIVILPAGRFNQRASPPSAWMDAGGMAMPDKLTLFMNTDVFNTTTGPFPWPPFVFNSAMTMTLEFHLM